MDKVVEYFVGDGPNNRFALICAACYGHNGMALPNEFEYIGMNLRVYWMYSVSAYSVRAYLRACVRVCVRACVRTCVQPSFSCCALLSDALNRFFTQPTAAATAKL